ncbi:hypothetical protein B0H14DRAFT_2619974 [Mycena olivaceomarginata]|nr:hypothetical protein B0H14DRAFT_2619974 [Mycena olivaceomarginata]
MSAWRTFRGQCSQCTACAAWVGVQWDATAGQNVFCNSTRTWDMQTSCLCPAVLMSHSLLLEYALVSFSLGIAHPYLFSSPFLPVQPDIVLPPAPRAPVHGSSAPAMDSFGGVPPPSRRTMAAQRTSSAARTLVRGPFSVSNHTGARGQYPNATSFNTQDLMVVLWPMVILFCAVIYSVDYKRAGHIVDDVKPLPAGCRLTARIRFLPLRNRVRLVPDLPYIYDSHWRLRRRQVSAHARARKATPADVISLSGCKDGQTSADTFIRETLPSFMSGHNYAKIGSPPEDSTEFVLIFAYSGMNVPPVGHNMRWNTDQFRSNSHN